VRLRAKATKFRVFFFTFFYFFFYFSSENPEAFHTIELCDHEVSSSSAGFLLGLLSGPEDEAELFSEILDVTTQKTLLFILTAKRTSDPT
jgi:hypothetical protein